MKILICSALALAIASPAVAEKSGTANKPDQATSSSATSPSATDSAVTPVDPSTDTSATPAAPSAQASDPQTILKTEFPVYDKDANGALNKDEFSSWLLALKKAAPQQTPLTDAQQTEWLGKAFKDADSDKNVAVSLAELTTYLTRGSQG